MALLKEYWYKEEAAAAQDENVWNEFFEKLMEYKRVDGRFVFAKNDNDSRKLYDWIARQRKQERHGTLSPDRRERLVEVGFEFRRIKLPYKKTRFTEQQEKKWDELYAKLCDFYEKHGHCIVTYNDENNDALAKWVSLQRVNYRKGFLMSETRQQRLDELNFTWSIQQRQPHQES
jgi:hypothetical protein